MREWKRWRGGTYAGPYWIEGNSVTDNELDGNHPADVFWDQTGTGNKVHDNDCDTAIPGNLGWCGP